MPITNFNCQCNCFNSFVSTKLPNYLSLASGERSEEVDELEAEELEEGRDDEAMLL